MKLKITIAAVLLTVLFCTSAWAGLTQTQVSQLYVSIFGRASEGDGNAYWQKQHGVAAAAAEMLATDAAKDYFGTSLDSDQAFIAHIYLNTLNKTAAVDPDGIAYWVNQLAGDRSRGSVVADLVGAINDYAPDGRFHNPDDAATVAAYNQFTNRVKVSDHMAKNVNKPPAGWQTVTQMGTTGLGVTDDAATVAQAISYIDTFLKKQLPGVVLGESAALSSKDIPPTGDVIQITDPAHPLHGMEITVPPGAYTDTTPFRVSSAPVESHTFGDLFEPLTPMITVENGGAYSEETMIVKIPVQVPEDYFAMAFYYHEDQGTLEPMQLISADSESITVSTRHFSDLVVTGIAQSVLDAYLSEGIRSDFYPGVDDWSFVNRGSYIAPKGHCAGQSLGALWYFTAKPEGNQPLWGSYDNNFSDQATPDLWEDDSYAYRFCSVLQEDMDWESFEITFWSQAQGRVWKLINNQWELVDVPAIGPEGTRNMFALAMLLTEKEPQFVGIYSDAGGGHAMIVWSVTRDALHIADPNYPGRDDRLIYFSNGAFDPYSSGANWEDIQAGKGKDYETIMFLAKSTLISWENIAQRWQEVKDGTIGNDLFPGYQLLYRDEDTSEFKPLGENQVFTDAKVRFSSSGDGEVSTGISIYRDGERLPFDGDWKIDLVPGDNLLGFNVLTKVGDDWEYVDFQYVNVVFSQDLTLVETYHNPHSDSPDLKERYWVDGKGIKQGTYESFHKNGAIDRKGSYQNDLREGAWVSRWDNGNMASEGSYTAGNRQGVWKLYYEDGNIGSIGSFKDDKLDGLWESWRSDGVKEEDQRYKEGVKHGLWTRYHIYSTSDNLLKSLEGMYDNGEKTGTWTYWNNLGEVYRTEEY